MVDKMMLHSMHCSAESEAHSDYRLGHRIVLFVESKRKKKGRERRHKKEERMETRRRGSKKNTS